MSRHAKVEVSIEPEVACEKAREIIIEFAEALRDRLAADPDDFDVNLRLSRFAALCLVQHFDQMEQKVTELLTALAAVGVEA